jgi:hypothetical protein
MKRELKFRFWIEAVKKMSDWETAKKECNRLSLLSLYGWIPSAVYRIKGQERQRDL